MLTDAQIRKAKAADKPYKLIDGGGLHVYVTSAGGKLWRLRYEFERKEKLLSMGPYPSSGVAEARETAIQRKAPSPGGKGSCCREAAQAPANRCGWRNHVRDHRSRMARHEQGAQWTLSAVSASGSWALSSATSAV